MRFDAPISGLMRNLILPILITVWGAGIVLRGLLGDGLAGDGAYGAGQMAGLLIGFVMLGLGVRHLIRHFSTPRA